MGEGHSALVIEYLSSCLLPSSVFLQEMPPQLKDLRTAHHLHPGREHALVRAQASERCAGRATWPPFPLEGQLLRPLLGDPEDRLKGKGTDSQKSEQHIGKTAQTPAPRSTKARHQDFCRNTSQ